MVKNIHRTSYKVPFILSVFNKALIFSMYLKTAQIRVFIKIPSSGSLVVHYKKWNRYDEAFRNFEKAPKTSFWKTCNPPR